MAADKLPPANFLGTAVQRQIVTGSGSSCGPPLNVVMPADEVGDSPNVVSEDPDR
jgi:hypothetical protein